MGPRGQDNDDGTFELNLPSNEEASADQRRQRVRLLALQAGVAATALAGLAHLLGRH
jgi:hypothetical protein